MVDSGILTEVITAFADPSQSQSFSNSIIQVLNRWIPNEEDPNANYFDVEGFLPTAQNWTGTPIIYAQWHPDLKLFRDQPDAALTAVNGRIVGVVTNSWIEQQGHPRLMASLQINDSECISLWDQGKLSLSTGFFCKKDPFSKYIVGSIEPNHILVFAEDQFNMPKDRGSMIMNKNDPAIETGSDTENSIKTFALEVAKALKEIFSIEQSSKPVESVENKTELKEDMTELEELKQKVDSLTKESTTVTEALKQKEEILQTVTKERDDYLAIINSYKQKESDMAFNAVLEKVPKGLHDTDEKRTALRNKYDAEPHAFYHHVIDALVNKTPETHKEGEIAPVINSESISPVIGSWNPYTKKYEVV